MTLIATETELNERIVIKLGDTPVYFLDRDLGGDWYLRTTSGKDLAHSQYRNDLVARVGAVFADEARQNTKTTSSSIQRIADMCRNEMQGYIVDEAHRKAFRALGLIADLAAEELP